jgi:arsenical pump membrane protein
LVYVIAAVAMLLLGLRPWRVHTWIWPLAGAAIFLATGLEPPGAALGAVARQWNVLLFILGLMALSAAAEESGAFEWMTQLLLQRAGGSQRRLFVYLFLAGAAVTIVLSNDATAIALTPIVYRAVSTRSAMRAEPFLYGCIFVANTASFGLPFSNPANVLILPHARLLPYLWHLGPPEVLAIAANLGIFLFFFRRRLRGRYRVTKPEPPSARTIATLWGMLAMIVVYVVALIFNWPLGPVALAGGSLLVFAGAPQPVRATRHIKWDTFVLLAGLFVLLDAVTRAGFTQWALRELNAALGYGHLAFNAVAAGGAALTANLFNNLPVAVAASQIATHSRADGIAYPLIAGVDLGPNLFTSGSLATILWLAVLRRYGLRVSRGEYLRLGAVVVPVTLGIAVLWLWLVG